MVDVPVRPPTNLKVLPRTPRSDVNGALYEEVPDGGDDSSDQLS